MPRLGGLGWVGVVLVLLTESASVARADSTYFEETHYDVGVQGLYGVGFGGANGSGTVISSAQAFVLNLFSLRRER